MADTNETVANIIAEMKREAEKIFPALPIAVLQLANRIEAAWKRERGNCAKLREALETMNNLFERGVICTSYANSAEEMEQIEELYRKTKAALDAPPRNCDIYTTEDAVDTATVTVRDECDACPNLDMEAPCVFCMVRWLLAPATAKEGGAK